MALKIKTLADDHNLCGEAPTWDEANHRILWVDAESSLVYQLDLATGEKTVMSRGLMVGGIALNRDNTLVFAGATGVHLWKNENDCQTLVSEHEGEALYFNDIIADAAGRIYAGTLYWGADGMEKHGKLYRIDTDGSVHVVDDGIELSNGLGFSPDNQTLYYADSSARKIYAYQANPQTGELTNKRVFVQVPDDEGIPDGLTVDAEGFVWSAQWYGGQVVRYDPEGKVERHIQFPVKQTSSVTFGGEDLRDLYITSAGEYWQSTCIPTNFDANAPMGGGLYRVRLKNVQGKPEHRANLSSTVQGN